MRVKENLQYYSLKSGWYLLSLLPFRIMYLISDGLFFLIFYIIRYRRKLVRKNLSESFPEKGIKEISHIEKRFYHFFTDYVFETCKLATISKKEMMRRMIFTNIDVIESEISQGKSVTLFLGHYCNWEWISSLPMYISTPFTAGQVYQEIKNVAVDRLFLENRGKFGSNSVELNHIARWANMQIKNNHTIAVGYIADQSPHWHSMNHWIHFLNHETSAFIGPEKITKKYDFQAYFIDIKRPKRGCYQAEFIKLHDDPKSLPDFELTDIYFSVLEKTIHRDPTLYLWTHNRFKRTREEYEKRKSQKLL